MILAFFHLAVGTTCTKASHCVTNADCDKATSKCTCSTGYEDINGKCSEQSKALYLEMFNISIVT